MRRLFAGSKWPGVRIYALAPALTVFVAFWAIPFVYLVVMGAEPDNSTHLNAYLTVLTRSRYLSSLGTTLLLSAAVSLAAVAISAVVACYLARHAVPGKGLLLALLTFPLAFPGVVVGFLMVMLGGRQGLLAQLSVLLTGERLTFAYSLGGLFLGYLYFSIPRSL